MHGPVHSAQYNCIGTLGGDLYDIRTILTLMIQIILKKTKQNKKMSRVLFSLEWQTCIMMSNPSIRQASRLYVMEVHLSLHYQLHKQ